MTFRYFSPEFGANVERAFLTFGPREFLALYPKDGPVRRATLTEFAADVNRVRGLLRREKEPAHTVVCVGGNTYEMLAFLTAALLEARTTCPLNAADHPERIAAKIESLGETATVFAPAGHALVLSGEARAMAIPAELTSAAPPARFRPGQPFILIFTSGTTGRAKIVEQTERGVMLNVDALAERHALTESPAGARIGTCLPVFHVNALEFSFFSTLLTGGHLTLFETFDVSSFLRGLEEERIEILSVAPPILAVLSKMTSLWSPLTGHLRYFVSAAAPISPALATTIVSEFPKPVLQGYGLSEAVNFSALTPRDLDAATYRWAMTGERRPSIGTELRGNEILVVDEAGKPLPDGELGELALRGPILMQSYRGEPPATTFREGYFRTGDLGFAKKGPNGACFFFVTGRKKEIAKRMGFTVSLLELDDLLFTCPGPPLEAITVAFDNEIAGEEIAVIVQGANGARLPEVRDFLRARLPAHLRPRVYAYTAASLRSPSGKAARAQFRPAFAALAETLFSEEDRILPEAVAPVP